MSDKMFKILLVEDNPGDARLVREMLALAEDPAFDVTHAERLDDALKMLSKNRFDAVLLDLALPDSAGVATLDRTKTDGANSNTPVLVITGQQQGERDVDTIEHGADDYLQKSSLGPEQLIRSLYFAIERHRSRSRDADRQAEEQRIRELDSLQSLDSPTTTSITARSFGFLPLREASPDSFEVLVEQYCDFINRSLENRKHELSRRPSPEVRVMAQRLGFLRAGPRDVVTLHLEALKRIQPKSISARYVATEEARYMLIELLGNLTAYYRDHMSPLRRPSSQTQKVSGKENS